MKADSKINEYSLKRGNDIYCLTHDEISLNSTNDDDFYKEKDSKNKYTFNESKINQSNKNFNTKQLNGNYFLLENNLFLRDNNILIGENSKITENNRNKFDSILTDTTTNNDLNTVNYNEITLNNEYEQKYKEETFFNGFLSSISFIFPVFILDFVFYLFLNCLNTFIIGSVNFTFTENEIIDAIGFTNNIMHLSLLPLYYGFGNILAILGSQAYGGKRIYLFNFIIDQTRLFGYMLACVVGLLIILSYPYVTSLFSLSMTVSKLSLTYTCFRMASYIFEYEIYLMLIYLQIIDKGLNGLVIVLSMFLIFPFLAYTFISNWKLGVLGEIGAGLTYLTTNFILFLLIKIYTYKIDINSTINSDCDIRNTNSTNLIQNNNHININSRTNIKDSDIEKSLHYNYSTIFEKYHDEEKFTFFNEKNKETRFKNNISKSNREEPNGIENFSLTWNSLLENAKCNSKSNNLKAYSLNLIKKLTLFINNTDLLDTIIMKLDYIKMILCSYQIYFQYSNLITISFFDILSAELISTMAIFTPSLDYTAYIVTTTIYGLVQCINMAFSVCANVNIGYFIGKGDYKKGKDYFIYLLIQTNIMMILACTLCFIYKQDVLLFLAEPGELFQEASKLYSFTLVINIQDSTFAILLSTLKTLSENTLALNIMISYNIINGFIMFFLAFKFSMSVKGLFYGYVISDIIVLIVLLYVFYSKVDWVSQTKSTLKLMESNEILIQKLESQISEFKSN